MKHQPMNNIQQGFSLVWALILAAILSLVAASLIQTASVGNRSVQAITQRTLVDIERSNILTYSQRLLEANASTLARSLTMPNTAAGLSGQLQAAVNTWCARDPDGKGANRIRIYFTSQACAQPLPAGVNITPAQLSTTGLATTLKAPFVIVAGKDVQRGVFTAHYGSSPASVYGLLSPDDLTLSENIEVDGDAHTDGSLDLQGVPLVTGTLSSSSCAIVSAQCQGNKEVRLRGVRTPVMSLLPMPARPQGFKGNLSLGQSGETAGLGRLSLSGLTTQADRILLGVLGSGEQLIRVCESGNCTDYIGLDSGDLALSTEEMVISPWNGVIGVIGGGGVTLAPIDPDQPSIVRPLSLVTPGALTIDGSLTYAQTSCAGNVCNASGANQFLSVQARDITVNSSVVRVHGFLISRKLIYSAPLTIFGSVISTPEGTGKLRIQEDPRGTAQVAPGIPLLSAQWRQAEVTISP